MIFLAYLAFLTFLNASHFIIELKMVHLLLIVIVKAIVSLILFVLNIIDQIIFSHFIFAAITFEFVHFKGPNHLSCFILIIKTHFQDR